MLWNGASYMDYQFTSHKSNAVTFWCFIMYRIKWSQQCTYG